MTYYVYIHKLISDGRVYVGQTHDIKERWYNKGFRYKNCSHIWNAIKKYGWDAFEHIVLFKGLTKQMADKIEEYLIEKYDSMNPKHGFNLRGGGSGGVMSEITKQRISAAVSGEKHPYYHKKFSAEHRRHLSEAHRGEKNSFYGKKHTEESRAKIRKARASQVHPLLGKKHTPEARRHQRAAKLAKATVVECVETGEVFVGLKEAGRQTGIDYSSISRCISGKQVTAGGYHWRRHSNDRGV